MMKACVNGRMVDEGEPALSPLDSGILYGYGLFETMLASGGRVFRLGRHLARLKAAASLVGIPLTSSDDDLHRMVGSTLVENGLRDAYVRLTLTRGVGEPRMNFPNDMRSTVIVVARSLPEDIGEKQSKGVRLAISSRYASFSRDIRSKIKSTNYMVNALARQEADALGVDDVILLNEKGHVGECSTANIFAVAGGRLLTPSTENGILPGVTREAVLELANKAGIAVKERSLKVSELMGADEAFKTSSIMGLVPVTKIGDKTIGIGKPGPITRRLQNEYQELVRRECK